MKSGYSNIDRIAATAAENHQPYSTVASNTLDFTHTTIHNSIYYSWPAEHAVIDLGVVDALDHIDKQTGSFTAIMQNNIGVYFTAGSHYFVAENSDKQFQAYYFTTPHALSVASNEYEEPVIDVIDTTYTSQLGSGSFADVYPVIGNIKPSHGRKSHLMFSPGEDKSVVKIGKEKFTTGDDYIQSVDNEYGKSIYLPHLRARPPTFGPSTDHKQLSCSPLRRVKGKTLINLLNDQANHPLSIDDRYQLSIALYRQLAKQIHQQRLIHCDIKPGNIMAYKDDSGWHVNIIDVNLAITEDEERLHEEAGTKAFMAEEAFSGEPSKETDTFAMSLVVAILWNDKEQLSIQAKADHEILPARKAKEWKIPFDMFDGISDLPPACQKDIITLLTHGTERVAIRRLTAGNLCHEFEAQYLTFKKQLSIIPEDHQQQAEDGFKAGLHACGLFAEYCKYRVNETTIEKLRADLTTDIKNLPDDHYAIAEFISVSGLEIFKSCHDKKSLLNCLTHAIDDFHKEFKNAKALADSLIDVQNSFTDKKSDQPELAVAENDLSHYRKKLDLFFDKILRTGVDLDDIVSATAHLKRKQSKISAAKEYYTELLLTETSNQIKSP